MAGTVEGGIKARKLIMKRHGKDFYKKIGQKGGSKSHPETRFFSLNPEMAKKAGRKGGLISKRGPAKKAV